MIGTFLVRSGILTSVHTFALDPSRGMYILIFTTILGGYSLILFGRKYWKNLINFDYLSNNGLITENDLEIFKYADTASEAWSIIESSKITRE